MASWRETSFLILLLTSVCMTMPSNSSTQPVPLPGLLCEVTGEIPFAVCDPTMFPDPVCHAMYRHNGTTFTPSHLSCHSGEHCVPYANNCILELVSPFEDEDGNLEYSCCCNATLCNQERTDEDEPRIIFPIPNEPITTTTTTTVTVTMVQGLPDGTITAIVVTLAIIALVVVMFAIGVICCCWKRCRNDEYLVTNDTGRPYPTYTGSRPNLTGLLLSEAVLGEGSDGVVYEGTYQENKVAVKVFRENSRERFFREVAVYTSSSVNHQNILKFIGHDEKEMRLMVALHTRGSVYTVIQRQVLMLAEFQLLGKSISCGLGFLHRSRPPCIVHGDLKTANILIKQNGEAALADFGHSRQFFTEDVKEPMTAGTPMYAAPELMKVRVNSRTDAKATDSYSLGVVIYELLTRTQRDQEEVEAYKQPMSGKLAGIQEPTIDEMRRHIHNNSYRPNIPKKFDVFPELVKLVQDLWSDAAETRPKAEAAYNAFIEFGLLIAPPSQASASASCTAEHVHLSHQPSLEIAETAF